MTWSRWAIVVLSIWMILSPFIFNFPTNQAIWNNIIVGFLILVFAFITKRSMVTT